MLSVAGSGKTTRIVNALDFAKRSLVITYTENNLKNLRAKIIEKFGHFPANITLLSYFTFLYSFCFRPFLWFETGAKGIRWSIPPQWTSRIKRDKMEYYFDSGRNLYHNRIAKLLEVADTLPLIKMRVEKYYDMLLIDEVQDFAGHDFNFLSSLAGAKVDMLFVGDFYQHTFDTSRDGNVNKTLYDKLDEYIVRLEKMGLTVDCQSLLKSYRCSPTLCTFISENLGIKMGSHRTDITQIHIVEKPADLKRLHKCPDTVKLFYKEHYKNHCYSRNWGDSKGEDHYGDVCVVLNKTTHKLYETGLLSDLNPQTRNKLYVACSRTRGSLYLVSETLYRKTLLCAS